MKINIPFEKNLFGKKAKLEEVAEASLNKLIQLAVSVNTGKSAEELERNENEFSEYFYAVVNSMDDYILPFWWKDFFSIETELKSLFSEMVIFTEKIRIAGNRISFDLLLKQEILILEKIKKYFTEILPGTVSDSRLFIEEISADNRNLQKSFVEFLRLNRQDQDSRNSLLNWDFFEKLNQINERIFNSLTKINLGAAV